jgi:hypothetical protein
MIRCSILNMSAIIMLGLTLLSTSAVAQQKTLKDQLVGTWMIVSTDGTRPDGTARRWRAWRGRDRWGGGQADRDRS